MSEAELDSRDREVLETLAEGRANPMLIREQTDLDKGDVNTALVRLGRGGYVEQITRGLYEITPKGRAEVGKPSSEDFDDRDGNLDTAVMLIEDAQTTTPLVEERAGEIEKARDELNAWLDKHSDPHE
ncbi:hypothetical protein GCM10009725_30100 [Aeromicrobium tamlense]